MVVKRHVLNVHMTSDKYFGFGKFTGHLIRSALINNMVKQSGCGNIACDRCDKSDCVLKHTLMKKCDGNGKIFMNPMYIESEFVGKKDYIATTSLDFKIILLGGAIDHLDAVKKAVEKLEFNSDGLKGTFRLVGLEEETEEIVVDIKDDECKSVKITFETPYIYKPAATNKFKKEVGPVRRDKLDFNSLMRTCTTRVTALMNSCCDGEHFDYRRFTDKKYDVKIVDSNLHEDVFARHSSRRDKDEYIRALSGYVVYEGNIDEAYGLLELVSKLNIGKETTLGFGKIICERRE